MSKKTLERMKRTAEREFTVTLVPYGGGSEIVQKSVVAYTGDLAIRKAESCHPGYIGTSARCTKVLVKSESI